MKVCARLSALIINASVFKMFAYNCAWSTSGITYLTVTSSTISSLIIYELLV